MIKLILPFPPSLNSYWRHVVINNSPRVLISRDGREYRRSVLLRCNSQGVMDNPPLGGRLSVVITAYPPDRRKRDLDNLAKAALDALTAAGVWGDDSQIDDLRIIRGGVARGGRMVVEVADIPAFGAEREAA